MKFKKKNDQITQDEFFSKFYSLERELYVQALNNLSSGKKSLAALKQEFVIQKEITDEISNLIDDLSKLYTKSKYSTDKFYSAVNDLVHKFYVMDAPRIWVKNIIDNAKDSPWLNELNKRNNAVIRYRNKFIDENLYLVKVTINLYDGVYLPEEDIFQEGSFGLIRAIEKFDVIKGNKFSTYGIFWIRHYISRALSNKSRLVRMPVHLGERNRAIAIYKQRFYMLNGCNPTNEQISKELSVPLDSIEYAETKQAVYSMDQRVGEESEMTGHDIHEDDQVMNQFEFSNTLSIKRRLALAMRKEKFSKRERDIINGRFGFSTSNRLNTGGDIILNDLAAKHNVCRERIRQIETRLLGKMRPYFEINDLCA